MAETVAPRVVTGFATPKSTVAFTPIVQLTAAFTKVASGQVPGTRLTLRAIGACAVAVPAAVQPRR